MKKIILSTLLVIMAAMTCQAAAVIDEIKKIDDVSYVSKSKDDFLRAHYELQKNGKKYMIDVTYPVDKKEQFDKDVESLVKSFKVK